MQAIGLLQKLEFGERADKPCYLKATFLQIGQPGVTTRTIDECGSRGPTQRSRVEIGDVRPYATPYGIYSIKVCVGESPRLKGIRLERRNMLFNGAGIASMGQEYRRLEMKRTNCQLPSSSGWDQTARTCPATPAGAPTVAVGLGVTLNRGSIVNMRLKCMEIRRTV